MIELTKIDGSEITVNADEIETMEPHHDTTLTLRSGRKLLVRESAKQIKDKVIDYKRQIFSEYKNSDE